MDQHILFLLSYGVFLAYFTSQSTFPGSRTLDYAFIGGLSASQALFISPLVTVLHRRIGLKATMALGVLLETAAFLGASWSACFGWGLGMHLAAGIATGGSGTGGLIYSLSMHVLLARFGLGWSYCILAICQLVVNAICLLVIRDCKGVAAPNRSFYINFRLCTRYEMWLYLGWSFFSIMGFMVIWFLLVMYGRSVGLTSSQGSIVTAVMNVGQMVGRPAVGFMSDAVGRINIATFATLISGLLCLLLWMFARTYTALICFVLFVGVFFGTFWTLNLASIVGPLGAEVVALEDLQSGLTIMWLFCSVPAMCERLFPLCPTSFNTNMSKDNEILIRSRITVGEAIGLELRTSGRHEFLYTQLFTGFMYIGAALCLVML
ncbi:MFS general substrate transporter [Aspergillus neoniger CBS 115656]|uniref:MFS general substrate transporter n=1 Tax=Aspergillus neoniger (strain CBS 115656) TaxID=1448310 RepID=A0A318ZTA9_ASPNB|nr:MFS general substrate transporter [Aspergillus neoniger CBS 115656]PYH38942.1 MFS general substrate transporter [Aspergillus neoniger CBS 115656]